MKQYALSVYLIWIPSLVLQLFACWAMVRTSFFTHWKAFGYYLFFMTAESALFLPLSFVASANVYAITYDVGDFLEAVLLSLVVLEILVKVLEPFDSLPGRTVTRFCFWALIGVAAAVTLSVMVPFHQHNVLVDLPLTVERSIFLALAIILWVLLLQAKAFGITWRSAVAEIAIGFVLYLTVQATTRFVIGIFDNVLARDLASEVGQFAYLVALASWTWTITHRDPVPSGPPADALAKVRELADKDDAVPKERIFAAVGIRINKPDPDEHDTAEETASQTERGRSRTFIN